MGEKIVRRILGRVNLALSRKIPRFFSPAYIEVSITNRCNLKCLSCSHQFDREAPVDMSFENFAHIVSQFPLLRLLNATSFGENFLHKDFFRMLEYLKSKDIDVTFNDNFTLLGPEIAEKLVLMGNVSSMVASMDAPDSQTFKMLRGGVDLESVVKNIELVNNAKKRFGIGKPSLSIYCTVSSVNVGKMTEMVEMAKALGMVAITFAPIFKMSCQQTYLDAIQNLEPDPSQYALEGEKAVERGRRLNIAVYVNSIKFAPILCKRPWEAIYINQDGSVWPCCLMIHSGPNNEDLSFGNIFRENFRSIWMSKRYANVRRDLRKGKLAESCDIAGHCAAKY